jgi:hypothetical protein
MYQKISLISKITLSVVLILFITFSSTSFDIVYASFFDTLANLHWKKLSSMELFTIAINIVMFIFAKQLITEKDTLNEPVKDYRVKVIALRVMNVIFFGIFSVSYLFDKSIGTSWMQSYLLILGAYTFTHWVNHWILIKYGDHEAVGGEIKITGNYLSTVLMVSFVTTSTIFSIVCLINIWDMTDLLQSGSAFVTLGIIIFATKEFWLEEFLASFVVHAKGKLKRGAVIQLSSGSLYVMLETNFIGSRLKGLKTDIEISLPNSYFVRNKVNILSIEKLSKSKDEKVIQNSKKTKKEWKPIKQYIHFNIGYSSTYEDVASYFKSVIEESAKQCNSILPNYELNLNNNGDHAVTWEVIYIIDNPFHTLTAKNIVNLVAFQKQKEFDIELGTPITYTKVD